MQNKLWANLNTKQNYACYFILACKLFLDQFGFSRKKREWNRLVQGRHGEFEPGKVQYSTPNFVDRLFLIRAYWNPKSWQGPILGCLGCRGGAALSIYLCSPTLDSGINVALGTFVKNNKHSPLKKHIPLHKITEFRTFLWITLFNKNVAPGKNSKNQ